MDSSEAGIRSAIAAAMGLDVLSASHLGGGDVAESFEVELADPQTGLAQGRTVFAKTHRSPPPGFFTTEAAGLRWLRDSGTVDVPEVLAVADGPVPLLVLEWIDPGVRVAETESALGCALAELHRGPWLPFGRPDSRTTGSRGLPNDPCGSWSEFYATCRLLPLARLARNNDALPSAVVAAMEEVAGRLDELGGDPEPPSLLHGDLWAGNRLVDTNGRNWLIDPAAHGGHREFDLAMMRLFGGFGDDCFSSYAESHPLQEGWQERIALHQIAPLVVHAIKFGGGYVSAATDAIRSYC